ncbi:RDD family protein [Campylobacter sp.]|uniref:RDD family protein n=1 Tax=Campylobacter sp. TaxID=205 RepID=UPI003613A9FE
MSRSVIDRLENENITLASVGKRAVAWGIDKFLLSALFFVIYYDKFDGIDFEQTVVLLANLTLQIVLLDVIYQTFFTWYCGASIGKVAMKIVCVDIDLLDKPGLLNSLTRSLVRIIGENAFFLGFAWVFSNPLFQTWQDKAAKTVVINVY